LSTLPLWRPGAYDDTFDVQGVAANLNASAANLKLLLPKKEQEDFDWEKAIREIQSIGDRVTVASARAKGKISNVLARVNAVQDSFDRARDSAADVDFAKRTAQIVNHTVLREVEKVGAAASAAQKILNQQRRVVNVYLTTSVASLASIAVTLAVPIDDLISLNSAAARSYEVPRGFPIRYYSKVSR
jgi:hypothetical protein